MAGSIKGIIVEIGGDTSGLQKALSKVNSATSSLSKELRGVNSLLKLDPTNTELLTQKQELLNDEIALTSQKLEELKKHQEEVKNSGTTLTDEQEKNYRALQREIISTENKLKNLKLEASNWTTAGKAIEEVGTKIDNVGSKIDSLGNKLTTRVTAPLLALGVVGVKSAAEQEAAMQQVELIYGDASNTIKDFAENTAIAYNISTSDAYKYAQIYGNLIQSITDDEEENALYTQELLKASSVIASATGRTMEDVLDRIRSGLLGNTEAIEDLGVNVNVSLLESTDAFKKFAGDKSWNQLDFQTQQQIRLFGILEQTTKKYGDEVNKNTSSDIQRLTAKFNNLTSKLSKKLLPIADKLIDKAEDFLDSLEDLTDEEMDNIIQTGLMVAAAGPLIKILGTVTSTAGKVTKGIGTFSQALGVLVTGAKSSSTSVNNLANIIKNITSPLGLATIAVAGLTTALVVALKSTNNYVVDLNATKEKLDEAKQSQDEFNQSVADSYNSQMSEIKNVEDLSNELDTLVDKNGKVKEGYEGRVSFILNELNDALGTEYELNGNIIESYDEISKSIDDLIKKKRAETILSSEEEKYNEAINKQAEAYENLTTTQDELTKAMEKLGEVKKNSKGTDTDLLSIEIWEEQVKKAQENVDSAKQIYQGYLNDIATYEKDYETIMTGSNEQIDELLNKRTYTYQATSEDIGETIAHNIQQVQTEIDYYEEAYQKDLENQDEYNAQKNLAQKEASETQLETLAQELMDMTSTTEELTPKQIEAWKSLASNSYDIYKEYINKMTPEMQQEIQDATGVIANDTQLITETNKLAIKMSTTFQESVNGKEWGTDLTEEVSEGMTSSKSKSLVTGAASVVAGWISDFLHFTVPDKGPLSDMDKSMPDMIDLMAKGIYSSKYRLIKATDKLASDLNNKLLLNNGNISNLEKMQNTVVSRTIDNTKTIFTTPQITFNVQELDEAKLEQCFNYINRKFGSQY